MSSRTYDQVLRDLAVTTLILRKIKETERAIIAERKHLFDEYQRLSPRDDMGRYISWSRDLEAYVDLIQMTMLGVQLTSGQENPHDREAAA